MHYHLVGICGISMSGLARLLIKMGNVVSGSDLKKCQISPVRQAQGKNVRCQIYQGHSEKNINKDIDELIYTAACEDKNAPGYVEVKKAQEMSIKTISRSKFIGKLMNDKVGIAITGTHGKTTTSTMISLILEAAGYDPTCLIGTEVKEWRSNIRVGGKTNKDRRSLFAKTTGDREYFVAEACDYARQMLNFRPKAALITNMEEEHLDTYKNGMKDIKQTFKKFVKLLPKNGLLVLCTDDKNVATLKKYAKCKVKFYSAKLPWPGLKLKIPGKYNLGNATGAARLCHELGVSSKIIKKTLNNFIGAGRRSEIKGGKNGILVIDDYGHHPTEIKKTLEGIKEKYPEKKLVVVFQPHQQQRTKLLFNDFVSAFDDADKIIINKVYLIAGREKDTKENLAKKLTEKIKKRGKDIIYFGKYQEISDYLKKNTKKGNLILTMGATDIYKVGEEFLR